MKRSVVAESNASITTPGERIVVAGGTQGIGEGIARRFAQAGSEVWIIGRNESKAKDVLAQLKEISQKNKIDPTPEHRFIKADLSLIAENKRVAQDIRTHAGSRGIDYLVMSQGGPANGTYVPTSEGIDQHYAVQILSRFLLAYELAVEKPPIVKKGVLSIMAPGQSRPAVDYDDLDLSKSKKTGPSGILGTMARDSIVVDTFTEEFALRNSTVIFTHVFPGGVKTDFAKNSSVPWYFSAIAKVALSIAGTTPASYAEIPFYLLANPAGRTATSSVRFWNENVEAVAPNPALQDEGIRKKIWEHLMEITKTHPSE